MADNSKRPLSDLDIYSVPISEAERGDRQAAIELLKKSAQLVKEGEPIPQILAQWLSTGLQELAKEAPSTKAFNLSKSRGRTPQLSEEERRWISEEVHYSKAGKHKAINADGSFQGAYATVAQENGISENTVESIYKIHKEIILLEEKLRKERE